jgi:hypothetical protein
MKRLIVHGNPGVRKDGIIEYDGVEKVLFQVNRQGEWHGPDEPQLWCVIGDESEREDYDKRNYIPHWLEVETIDAEALDVKKRAGDMAV